MKLRTVPSWLRWLASLGFGGMLLAGYFTYLRAENQRQEVNYDLLEELYIRADTVFERHDSVFVVSRKLDTVAVETGIFTYLKYYYPWEMSTPLHRYAKRAVALARAGHQAEAREQYKELIDWHQDHCRPYHGFSDTNNRLTVGTQDAILCAYAYQQLGQLEEALAVLRPWLAHSETIGTKVQQLYLELCVQRYGRERVRRELAASPRTLHRPRLRETENMPEYDKWVIDVFGAEFGAEVGWDTELERPTERKAAAELPKQEFYQVLR